MGCVSLTFCLLMIVSYFVKPLWGSVKGYWIYWGLMKLHLVNLSTNKKHLYSSALTPNWKWEGLYNKWWGQRLWRIVKNIWDYLWCVENQRLIPLRSFKKKITKRVMEWKEKLISKAGKEILVKTVAQAIPTYSMSLFKLPNAICDKINSLLSNY